MEIKTKQPKSFLGLIGTDKPHSIPQIPNPSSRPSLPRSLSPQIPNPKYQFPLPLSHESQIPNPKYLARVPRLQIPNPKYQIPQCQALWFVYILECQDGSFYTGVTNDLDKRMKIHAEGKGSKYVRQKKFRKLLRTKKCSSRSDAQKAEYQIKKLDKWDKLGWFD